MLTSPSDVSSALAAFGGDTARLLAYAHLHRDIERLCNTLASSSAATDDTAKRQLILASGAIAMACLEGLWCVPPSWAAQPLIVRKDAQGNGILKTYAQVEEIAYAAIRCMVSLSPVNRFRDSGRRRFAAAATH